MRQLSPATAPMRGMPTIQAAGCPTSAAESTAARRSGGAHSAAASVPAVVTTAMPAPTGICAAASQTTLGAAALPSDPSASNADPHSSWRAEPDASAEADERKCGDAGDEPRHRAELPGSSDRDVEVASDLREHGRERDRRRLSREQGQEQDDADLPVPVALVSCRVGHVPSKSAEGKGPVGTDTSPR